jgi:tetratricopeptide (TPR) repeat protein
MNRAPACAAIVVLGSLACGPTTDARFASAETRANATARAGRHAEAAALWLDTARTAQAAADRDEALYRAAASYARAGLSSRAVALYDRLAEGSGERAARASFDRARLVYRTDPTRGDALLAAAIRRHPDSGLAPRALREHLARRASAGGARRAIDECTRLERELEPTELAETLRYERARWLERDGALVEARDAYLETARLHPYPQGALWDDALARAAEVELTLGRPRAAVALLERMLGEREASSAIGSYERARYAPARFRIAEIQRDRLADAPRARREFRRVFDDHPTSLLRDDALWQEALVAVADGDVVGACNAVLLLVEHLPESRYAPCAPKLCSSAPAVGRTCRALRGADLRDTGSLEGDHSSSSSSSSSSSP